MRAVKHLDRGLAGSPVEADPEELRDYLNAKTHRFLVPRPEHIDVLIRSINDVLAALAVARHPPRNDTVLIPHVDENQGQRAAAVAGAHGRVVANAEGFRRETSPRLSAPGQEACAETSHRTRRCELCTRAAH